MIIETSECAIAVESGSRAIQVSTAVQIMNMTTILSILSLLAPMPSVPAEPHPVRGAPRLVDNGCECPWVDNATDGYVLVYLLGRARDADVVLESTNDTFSVLVLPESPSRAPSRAVACQCNSVLDIWSEAVPRRILREGKTVGRNVDVVFVTSGSTRCDRFEYSVEEDLLKERDGDEGTEGDSTATVKRRLMTNVYNHFSFRERSSGVHKPRNHRTPITSVAFPAERNSGVKLVRWTTAKVD